jgi:hypothetical protein
MVNGSYQWDPALFVRVVAEVLLVIPEATATSINNEHAPLRIAAR